MTARMEECVHTYVLMCACTHTHTDTDTHTHTHTQRHDVKYKLDHATLSLTNRER